MLLFLTFNPKYGFASTKTKYVNQNQSCLTLKQQQVLAHR